MTAKTSTQRKAAYIERQQKAGLKELRNLWAHPADHPPIREAAEKLARRRERAAKKGEY